MSEMSNRTGGRATFNSSHSRPTVRLDSLPVRTQWAHVRMRVEMMREEGVVGERLAALIEEMDQLFSRYASEVAFAHELSRVDVEWEDLAPHGG